MGTTLEVVDGLRFDRGYLSPYFVSDAENMEAVLDKPLVLLTEYKISAVRDLLPVLDYAARTGRPLLLVAEDVEGEALAMLVVNRLRGTVQSVAVKAPESGERRRELLEDLSVLCGGHVVSTDMGRTLEAVQESDFGRAARVVVDREKTTVVGGGGAPESVKERIESLQNQLSKSGTPFDRDRLKARVARLSGGVAVIRVGGVTEIDLRERRS